MLFRSLLGLRLLGSRIPPSLGVLVYNKERASLLPLRFAVIGTLAGDALVAFVCSSSEAEEAKEEAKKEVQAEAQGQSTSSG